LNYYFLGISGHLQSGAKGHFETFHKGLFKAFQLILGEQNALFLGKTGEAKGSTWFDSRVPESTTSSSPWISKKFLRWLIQLETPESRTLFIYVYEGNLALLYFIGQVIRRRPNTILYLNFFNSKKYQAVLRSNRRSLFFKMALKIALRGIRSKVVISMDTRRLAELFLEKTGIRFTQFPIYSAFLPPYRLENSSSTVLVNIRGEEAERLVYLALRNAEFPKDYKVTLHGLTNSLMGRTLREKGLIQCITEHLDENEYAILLTTFSKVAFIYEPKYFSMQSSGRLADAIVYGAQIIVPKDTALEEMLACYGNGTTFQFGDPRSLISALSRQPTVEKSSLPLPTSAWAAERIIASADGLPNSDLSISISVVRNCFDSLLDTFIDYFLWLLRSIAGLRRRISLR
jgi:hypothetical protein